jgi:hypothetical protein
VIGFLAQQARYSQGVDGAPDVGFFEKSRDMCPASMSSAEASPKKADNRAVR